MVSMCGGLNARCESKCGGVIWCHTGVVRWHLRPIDNRCPTLAQRMVCCNFGIFWLKSTE